MPEREKVISQIEVDYREAERKGEILVPISRRTVKDALALLKEQEVGISKAETTTIVRCKDCKWWDKKSESPYGYCHACKHGYSSPNWEIGIYRTYKGDWFCADGEKRWGGV